MTKVNEIFQCDSFYFIRHGESLNNKLDLVNGWTDCPLTDKGRDQAKKAAFILKNHPVNRIITSDLQRAVETADIIARYLNLPVEKHNSLRERNWGIYENKPRSERPGLNNTPEGGESPEQFFDRIVNALQQLKISNNTLIVGHAGTMRVVLDLLGCEGVNQRISNSKPIIFDVKEINNLTLVS